jgi:hypothetical protein
MGNPIIAHRFNFNRGTTRPTSIAKSPIGNNAHREEGLSVFVVWALARTRCFASQLINDYHSGIHELLALGPVEGNHGRLPPAHRLATADESCHRNFVECADRSLRLSVCLMAEFGPFPCSLLNFIPRDRLNRTCV